jgi:hypothetical protein
LIASSITTGGWNTELAFMASPKRVCTLRKFGVLAAAIVRTANSKHVKQSGFVEKRSFFSLVSPLFFAKTTMDVLRPEISRSPSPPDDDTAHTDDVPAQEPQKRCGKTFGMSLCGEQLRLHFAAAARSDIDARDGGAANDSGDDEVVHNSISGSDDRVVPELMASGSSFASVGTALFSDSDTDTDDDSSAHSDDSSAFSEDDDEIVAALYTSATFSGLLGRASSDPTAPAPCARGASEPCRLVVLDCHYMAWRNHDEGTFDEQQRADASKWFYDAEWMRQFIAGCRANSVGVGVATFLHDLHDGVAPAVLGEMRANRGEFYSTKKLLAAPHDYDAYYGGKRLVRDIFARHTGSDIPLDMIEACMPTRAPMDKCGHIAQLVAAHNRRCAASERITDAAQVWLFDDSARNTTAACFEGHTSFLVLPTHGFSRAWFRYAVNDPSATEVAAVDVVALLERLKLADALAIAKPDG